jgi:prepilin peptidase CpaA
VLIPASAEACRHGRLKNFPVYFLAGAGMDFASFFSLSNWPLWLVCLFLIVAAVIDFWKLKVPNWLTFPMIFAGWAYGAIAGALTGGGFGAWEGLGASFALTWFGFALLLPVYSIGGMGAGDVKMQMAFAAWMGAIPRFGLGGGFWVVLYGFCLAAVIGGLIALGMMFWRGDFFQNRKNVAAIIRDWFTSRSVFEVADKAAARKPRMHLLPYGVPLCLGFIGYLLYAGL